MKASPWLIVLVGALIAGAVGGAALAKNAYGTAYKPVIEGVIFSVHYQVGGDRTAGFTRLGFPEAVPGDEGSWSRDAYGKLYQEFLILTYPGNEDLDAQVIPTAQLLSVQFGDGGISTPHPGPSSLPVPSRP